MVFLPDFEIPNLNALVDALSVGISPTFFLIAIAVGVSAPSPVE